MNRKAVFRAGGAPRGMPALASPVTYLADISEYQPDIADATYLAWSKAIVIRAAYGDAHDDAAWYGGARRADLHAGGVKFLGIYQYLVASQSAAAQAQAFHGLVGAIQPGEVFIADFEEGSKALLTGWYDEMLRLYGASINPYLWTYTGEAFGQEQGVLPVQWIADYSSVEPTSKHTLWQFTDAYRVPGIGTCDCSLYHGTVDELAALAYQPQPKPKPTPTPTPAPTPAPAWEVDMLAALPTLSEGSNDNKLPHWYVRRVQLIANEIFSVSPKLAVDGDFGPATKTGVEQVQRHAGLSVDGVVGPQTWGVLLTGSPA